MSELIDMRQSFDSKEGELAHFLIASFCKKSEQDSPSGRGDGMLEVTLTVNGVETSFRDAAQRWFEAYDDCVRREAEKMVKEKLSLSSIFEKINRFEYEIDTFIAREFGKSP